MTTIYSPVIDLSENILSELGRNNKCYCGVSILGSQEMLAQASGLRMSMRRIHLYVRLASRGDFELVVKGDEGRERRCL